jgi:HK97 family phage prohead protease
LHTFPLELKSVEPSGRFTGYASVYGNIDEVNDVVEHGAFQKTLNAGGPERPIYLEHRTLVGVAKLSDAPKGLAVDGQLSLDTQAGKDAFVLLRDRAIKALSIGYKSVKETFDGKGIRHLHEVKLFEVSLTGVPANEAAVITSVKSRSSEDAVRMLQEFKTAILAGLERKTT